MTRQEASDLAKFTAEALGAPYCVCRRRDDHEWWAALSEEAMVHFQGKWACPEYEVVELWRPDGRQIIASCSEGEELESLRKRFRVLADALDEEADEPLTTIRAAGALNRVADLIRDLLEAKSTGDGS